MAALSRIFIYTICMIGPFPISVSLQAALLKQISPRRRSFAPSLLSLEVTIKIPSLLWIRIDCMRIRIYTI